MSKCKRLKAQLGIPAFTVPVIDAQQEKEFLHTPAQSAADTLPASDILPYLCLGSWRDAESLERIKNMGITHVLNVAKECPTEKEQKAMDDVSKNLVMRQIPLVDAHSENILPHFEEAFSFIEEARAAKGKVLVHCRRGISRSPAIVTGYVMTKTGCTYENALDFVTGCRKCVSLNLAFREILFAYHPNVSSPDPELQIIVASKISENGSGVAQHSHVAQHTGKTPMFAPSDTSASNTTLGITPQQPTEEDEEEPASGDGGGSGARGFGDDDEDDEVPQSQGKGSAGF